MRRRLAGPVTRTLSRTLRLLLPLLLLVTPLLPPAGVAYGQRSRDDDETRPPSAAALAGDFTTQAVVRGFTSRFTANTNGDIVYVSNTVMSCPSPAAACPNARNGIGTAINNNDWAMAYVDVDSDATTFNSSRADLSLPAGATVLFAGLYWGGDSTSGSGGAVPPNAAARDQVRLATPRSGGAYTTITASTLDSTGGNGNDFQGFADITAIVRAAGNGTYTVANIQTGTGVNQQGGWSIVVAYGDPTLPTRNLTVFDGFAFVDNSTPRVSIPISGFLTPPTGPVRSKLGVIAYEGDRGFTGDSFSLDSTVLTDNAHPRDNFFTSQIANAGTPVTSKSPNYLNQLGYDASIVSIDGLLANGATSAVLRLTTGGESYYPGVVTFVADLFAPRLEVQKTVVDLNGGQLVPGDLLEYTITATNSGQDPSLQTTIIDPIPANTTYEPGTLQVGGSPRTDENDGDTARFDGGGNRVIFNVGTGATGAAGGTLAPAATVTTKFRVRVNVGAPDGQAISNTATTAGTAQTLAQPVSGNVTVESPPVSDKADLQTTKTDNAASAAPGAQVTYTIVVRNNGPSPVNGATVADTFPVELQGVTWACVASAGGACGAPNGVGNIATTVNLPVAGTATFTATGTVAASFSGRLRNTVSAAPPTGVADPDPSNNTATDDDAVAPVADLAITKTLVGSAVPGQSVTYTITARNNGPSAVTGARVVDTLPAQLGGATWTCAPSGGGACAAPNGSGSIDTTVNLPAGATATFSLTATVAAGAGGTLANTATVTAPAGVSDPTPGNNSATSTQALTPIADLAVTKVDDAATVQPRGQVTYTITATNAGPSAVSGARLADPFPPQLQNVSWTCAASAGSACGVNSGTGALDTTVNLAVGGTATVTATGTLASGASGSLANTSSITPPAGTTDPNLGNNGATATSPIADSPRIGVAKSVGTPVDNGDGSFTVSITLNLRNYGNVALSNVQLVEDLGAAFTGAVDARLTAAPTATGGLTPNPSYDGRAVTNLLAAGQSLAVGASASVSLSVRVFPGAKLGPYANQVTASGTAPNNATTTDLSDDGTNPDPDGDGDPNEPGENDASTVVFAPSADLSIAKSASSGSSLVGNQVTYTLTVRNRGPSGATDVNVVDPLGAGVAFVSATPGQGSCAPRASGFACALGTLANGVTTTITVVVTTQQVGTLANTATVEGNEPDPDTSNNGAAAGVVVQPKADLAITKVDSPDPVNVGQNVTSTLTVTNNGPSPATGVVLRDTLPAGLTFVSITPNAGCTGTQAIECAVGTLASGGSAVYTLVATATQAGTLTNLASVAGNESDPTPSNNGASQSTTAEARADIEVTKTGAPASPVVGTNVTYTVLVRNNGPSPATGVVLSDPLPAGSELVSSAPSQGQCSGSGTVICDLGALANGATATVSITVRTLTADLLFNTARATATEADPTPDNNASTAATNVTAQADLLVAKSASPAVLDIGDQTTFTITVTNNGPSPATNVVVDDPLPDGLTLVSAQPSQGTPCTGTTRVTCTLGTIANGASATVTVVASTTAPGTFVNAATAVADEPDPNPDNNGGSASISVAPLADLKITKTASPDPVLVGQNITYTITVTNSGPTAATGVVARDILPTNSSFGSVTPSQGTCSSGAQVSCNLGTIPNGGTVTITLAAQATAAGPMTNITSVSGTERDPNPADNGFTQTATARAVADLEITKTGPDTATTGSEIAYTLTVRNNGPTAATNVVIVDPVPTGTTFVSSTPSGGGSCAGTVIVVCSFPTLAAGATATVDFRVTAPATPGIVVNNASVIADEEDLDLSNNGASTGTTVGTSAAPVADLAISKLANQPNVTVGDNVIFNLVLSNQGPATATNVTILDRLPSGLTFVSATTPDSGLTCGFAAGLITCTTASLAVGQTVGVNVTVTATAAGTKVNVASVSATETDPNNDDNGATAAVTARPAAAADLVISKSPSVAETTVGSQISYNIGVTNRGPETATNVTVVDELPAGLSFVSATPVGGVGGSCGFAAGVVTCTFTSLAAPDTLGIVVVATATAPGVIANSASVTASEQDPDNSNNGTSAGVSVLSSADLRITKTKASPPDPLTVGQTVTYQISVTNDGPSTATNVEVTDALPPNLAFGSAAPSGGGTCTGTSIVVCTFASLANGATATVTLTGTITGVGTLVNVATVQANEPDPDPADNSATEGSTVNGQADLSLTKTAGAGAGAVGENVTYTITVQNNGPNAATDVTITDILPAGATFVSATPSAGGGCAGTSTVTCTFPTLAASATGTVTLVVQATAAGALTNAASVSATETDPDPSNNSDVVGVTVQGSADLSLAKTSSATVVGVGDQVVYTLSARNNGPSAATGVTITDVLPASLTLISATATQGSCAGAPTVTCTIGDLANGGTATVTITARVDAAGTIVNGARVAGREPDANNANNGATLGLEAVGLTPETGADVGIAKAASTSIAVVNDTITYTVTVTNYGPGPATGVTVTDVLPDGLTLLSVTPSQGSCVSGQTVTCALGTLAVGATATVTLQARATANGALINTATVVANEGDLNRTNNGATAGVSVGTVVADPADLVVTKTAPSGAEVGDIVTYRVVVLNRGPGSATGVRLVDDLPAGATFVAVTASQGSCVGGQRVVCTLNRILANDQATVEIRAQLTRIGVVDNVATATADQADPSLTNNAGTARTTVVERTGVQPSANNDDEQDRREERSRETETERHQREHTNRSGIDDVRTEGDVMGVQCDDRPVELPAGTFPADPPFVVIATRDGLQTVRLLHDARETCRGIRIGDYLEADGEKQHEYLFDADDVEIRRRGR